MGGWKVGDWGEGGDREREGLGVILIIKKKYNINISLFHF